MSLSVSELAGRVQGTHWDCVCTSEACDRSLFWRISMKCHEEPILLLIWLKQVGHQDGDAQSSWPRWLRFLHPPSIVAAVREQGQPGVPRAQGAGGRWGGRAGPSLRQWRYSLLSGRCAVSLPAPGSAFIPGGGDEPGCWKGSPGAGCASSLCTVPGASAAARVNRGRAAAGDLGERPLWSRCRISVSHSPLP